MDGATIEDGEMKLFERKQAIYKSLEMLDPKHFLSNWYQSIDPGPLAAEFLKFRRLIRLRWKKFFSFCKGNYGREKG
ncbi:hypothetical protein M5K25_009418 [Dendrobium thyrsiflorum]|uniref:Uncharacterized protein n=1 Tax=Dendrobium thyrsiflorum TaxID=117978 RepID=A0ABD0VCW9_DENTH